LLNTTKSATMKHVIIALVFLAGCSPHPSEPDAMTPVEEHYHIRTTPEWPEYRLVDTWLSEGGRYALKDSLWFIHDSGQRTAYPIECRSDGKEIWVATPGKQHVFRGILMSSGIIARYIVEGPNGRPGPAESTTFRRVQ
jgi:hypothetical protein